MQGAYAVLRKSVLSAGGREGVESQGSGKEEGFVSCWLFGHLPLQETVGCLLCNNKEITLRGGYSWGGLFLVPSQAAVIYWRWAREVEHRGNGDS